MRWPQRHFRKTDLQPRFPRRLVLSPRHLDLSHASQRLLLHERPQMSLSILQQPILFGTDKQPGAFGIFQSEMKQFVDVGFAIAHTDQHCVGTVALNFSDSAKALEPFVAFFFLDSPLLALMFLSKLCAVPC